MLQRQKEMNPKGTTIKISFKARLRVKRVEGRIRLDFPFSRLKGENFRVPFEEGELVKVELEIPASSNRIPPGKSKSTEVLEDEVFIVVLRKCRAVGSKGCGANRAPLPSRSKC